MTFHFSFGTLWMRFDVGYLPMAVYEHIHSLYQCMMHMYVWKTIKWETCSISCQVCNIIIWHISERKMELFSLFYLYCTYTFCRLHLHIFLPDERFCWCNKKVQGVKKSYSTSFYVIGVLDSMIYISYLVNITWTVLYFYISAVWSKALKFFYILKAK